MMFRKLNSSHYNNIVDPRLSFKRVYDIIPETYFLHWRGRTKSPGNKGVGYLSFGTCPNSKYLMVYL